MIRREDEAFAARAHEAVAQDSAFAAAVAGDGSGEEGEGEEEEGQGPAGEPHQAHATGEDRSR